MLTRKTSRTSATDSQSGRREQPPGSITLRPLRSDAEYRACVDLQMRTWGENFSERVPPTILKVTQRIGGIAAGAFSSGGDLLGFVFGMTGVEDGELVHWSDMLAVQPDARNLGLGHKLKQYQADTLRDLGVSRVYWTYDPLVARNAHLNLNKLGARVVEYVPDMYGRTESALHEIGTDRFVVAWRIDGSPPADGGAGLRERARNAPVLNAAGGDGGSGHTDSALARIEVPVNIEAVQKASLKEAQQWRESTRSAFLGATEQGFRVAGFYRETSEGPCYYVLTRSHDSQNTED